MIKLHTPEEIIKATSEVCDVPVTVIEDITNQTKEVARVRHVAQYLIKKYTFKSFKSISERFGQKDHGTALAAFERISKLLREKDELTQDCINRIEKKLTELPVG